MARASPAAHSCDGPRRLASGSSMALTGSSLSGAWNRPTHTRLWQRINQRGRKCLSPTPISVTPAPAMLAAPWTLGGAERQKARSETLPWKTSILWAALLAGVALLAGMESAARRILSGCARPRPPEVRAGHSRRFKPRPAQGRFALGPALPETYSARRASQSALLANLIATVLSAESRPNA